MKTIVRLMQRRKFSLLLIYYLLKSNYSIQFGKTKIFLSGTDKYFGKSGILIITAKKCGKVS